MTGLLDADAVAATLGVSKDWIYAEVRAGRIPHVRLGRNVRFRTQSIDHWIAELETGSMPVLKNNAPGRGANRPRHGNRSSP